MVPAARIAPNLPEEVREQLGFATKTVELKRAYKFRIYPMKAQAAELAEWDRQLKKLWNLAHEQRLAALSRHREWAFEKGQCPSCRVKPPGAHTSACDHVDYYRQAKEMTQLLEQDDQLARVICCARQEVLRDLDKAWQRWRKMPGVGRPRFKRKTDHCRVYLSTPKHWKVDGKYLELSGLASTLGKLRIELDRPWPTGCVFSSCAIVRDGQEWYATFPLTFTQEVAQAPHRSVGINRGAIHAIADSDGRVVDSPKFYVRALEAVKRRNQALARKRPGSRNFGKMTVRLQKAHQKVRRQRAHWLNQQSAHYTAGYDLVAIEDMSVKEIISDDEQGASEIVSRPQLPEFVKSLVRRSILDVGWYELARQIEYKAKAHGGELRKVDPGKFAPETEVAVGVSTECSACGAPFEAPASGHKQALCKVCGATSLGDLNAAENILARAMAMLPPAPKTPKASIKIKGRQKRPVTPVNRTGEAPGGDPSVRGPDERGTFACVVEPRSTP